MSRKTPRFYAFGPFRVDVRRRLLLRASDGRPVALTPKAFDLLVTLLEHRGRVLEKDELLRTVWPEQFVEEANLSVNVSALRRALGERATENRYVATVPRRGYRFVADVRELDAGEDDDDDNPSATETDNATAATDNGPVATDNATATPAATTAGVASTTTAEEPHRSAARPETRSGVVTAGPPNNLPIQLTPFVGRKSEAASVERLLRREDVRLVTLTGPGGSGKTRLALQVAAALAGEFADGLFFVDLDSIGDPRLVVSTIAQTLGVKEAGGAALVESLKDYLRERALLVVLDNFEQVVSAAPLMAELLAATRRLKLLVTSRAVLRVSGEHEFHVPPLVVPDLRGLPAAPELLQYSSVELFVQRATAARSDFLLTERNARAVAEICTRLEGLPLAIELAAARVRLLPPQAMLKRLREPFKLLTGGARDLPARQQTMSCAIAWSYDLLDDAGKCLFRRLSVFVGGATLDAAGAVCRETAESGEDIEEGVASLVDNSLLRQVEQPGGEPRFVMLETIREYGLERLGAGGDVVAARRRHSDYFLKLAEEADPKLGGARLDFWLEQLEQEHDNLRAALRWSLEGGDAEAGLRLVRSLWWFWYLHGHYHEGRDWIERVLEATAAAEPSAHRARSLVGAGVLAFLQCEYATAAESLDAGLELARSVGDREGTAMALQVLGSVARERGSYERAIARHQESLALWKELGDRRGIARSLNYVGFAAWLGGDFAETTRCCERALAMFREQGDTEGVVWALLNLAAVAGHGGEHERAVTLGGESLTLSREIGYKEGIAWSLNILGDVTRRLASHERATAMLQESLHLHHELGDRWRMASVLESLGGVAEAKGQPEHSALLFAAAERLREAVGTPLPPVERAGRERHLSALRAALGERAFAALWEKGRETPLEQSIARALELNTAAGLAPAPAPADVLDTF